MKAIAAFLICITLSALSACAGGDCDPAAVVSPQADSATRPAVVIGTADKACRDAAGNDVVCP